MRCEKLILASPAACGTGETNLKIKSSLALTVHATSPSAIAALKGSLEYEAPNKRLYTFLGKMVVGGREVSTLNPKL